MKKIKCKNMLHDYNFTLVLLKKQNGDESLFLICSVMFPTHMFSNLLGKILSVSQVSIRPLGFVYIVQSLKKNSCKQYRFT